MRVCNDSHLILTWILDTYVNAKPVFPNKRRLSFTNVRVVFGQRQLHTKTLFGLTAVELETSCSLVGVIVLGEQEGKSINGYLTNTFTR